MKRLFIVTGFVFLNFIQSWAAPGPVETNVFWSGDVSPTNPPTWTDVSTTGYIGNSGTGDLTITNGGSVSSFKGYIGYNSGSTGTVTVTGAGSVWTNSGAVYVGNSGRGELTINNGGAVSVWSGGYVGYNSGSTGIVTVTGLA